MICGCVSVLFEALQQINLIMKFNLIIILLSFYDAGIKSFGPATKNRLGMK
jgi:hypothetical protein